MHCHHKINYLPPPKYHSIPALSQHYSVQRYSESSADIASPRSADTAVQPSCEVYLLHLFLESLSSWWGNLLELVQMPIATPRAINTGQPLTQRFPPLTQILMKTNFSAPNIFSRRKRVIYPVCIKVLTIWRISHTSTYIFVALGFFCHVSSQCNFTHFFPSLKKKNHFENISIEKIFYVEQNRPAIRSGHFWLEIIFPYSEINQQNMHDKRSRIWKTINNYRHGIQLLFILSFNGALSKLVCKYSLYILCNNLVLCPWFKVIDEAFQTKVVKINRTIFAPEMQLRWTINYSWTKLTWCSLKAQRVTFKRYLLACKKIQNPCVLLVKVTKNK